MIAMRGQRSETSSTMWVDNHDALADVGEQVEEAVALFRIEARGRLVDDQQRRAADQRLGDAEALAHAAGEAGNGFLAHAPQVDLAQQRLDGLAPLAASGDALKHRHVVEHVVGADARIDAEILRQIAEHLTQPLRLLDHVDGAKADGAAGRGLQRRHATHQRGLARAVGAEQAEHPGRDLEADAVQGAHALGIDVAQILNRQHDGPLRVFGLR
jgi:hypothetical protein